MSIHQGVGLNDPWDLFQHYNSMISIKLLDCSLLLQQFTCPGMKEGKTHTAKVEIVLTMDDDGDEGGKYVLFFTYPYKMEFPSLATHKSKYTNGTTTEPNPRLKQTKMTPDVLTKASELLCEMLLTRVICTQVHLMQPSVDWGNGATHTKLEGRMRLTSHSAHTQPTQLKLGRVSFRVNESEAGCPVLQLQGKLQRLLRSRD